jgi:hypothetical protein
MGHQVGARVTREALRSYFPNGRFASRLRPLPEYGCIYVSNPKAASSTVTLWLYRAHSGDHSFSPATSIHAERGLPRPKEVGWNRVVQMLRGEAFRFTFVRDPVRRVESAYLDKVVRVDDDKRAEKEKDLREILGLPATGEPLTFDQFVAGLEMQEPVRMNPHWRPQHLNLMHGLLEYDLVGRVETFDADLAKVREHTGMPAVPVEVQNVAARRTDSLLDGRPDLLRRVRDIYARDLELYGY